MLFLILAHPEDKTASGVFRLLLDRRGAAEVALVSSEELVFAPHWSHSIRGDQVHTRVQFMNGLVLDSDEIGVVFNRLRYAHLPHFVQSSQADQLYAAAETYALWLSWLKSLPCPVVNPASNWGLGEQRRSRAEWLLLAARAGLPALAYRSATFADGAPPAGAGGAQGKLPTVPVNMFGSRARGELGRQFGPQLMALRELCGCDFFQVDFMKDPTGDAPGWNVSGVDSFPEWVEPEDLQAAACFLEDCLAVETERI